MGKKKMFNNFLFENEWRLILLWFSRNKFLKVVQAFHYFTIFFPSQKDRKHCIEQSYILYIYDAFCKVFNR